MTAALKGIDIAFHCAGKAGDSGSRGHAAATGRFARACAAARVRRLVYLSTVAVYGSRWSGEIGTDTPLIGASPYAASRIDAEVAVAAALTGTETRWSIVRVPMLVGPGMPGTVLSRFFRVLRLGVFPHPGPEDATLACLGVHRLGATLLRLPDEGNATLQFADHLRWTELARRYATLRDRPVLRFRLPNPGGRFAVLASTVRYADDAGRLRGGSDGLPATQEDLDVLIRP
jgi:nucleoside-diphosphate-sugar epimerase